MRGRTKYHPFYSSAASDGFKRQRLVTMTVGPSCPDIRFRGTQEREQPARSSRSDWNETRRAAPRRESRRGPDMAPEVRPRDGKALWGPETSHQQSVAIRSENSLAVIPTRPMCTTWEMPDKKRPKLSDSRATKTMGGLTRQQIVDKLSKVRPQQQGDHLWNKHWVPPDSEEDFVVTMRRQSTTANSGFQWPSEQPSPIHIRSCRRIELRSIRFIA